MQRNWHVPTGADIIALVGKAVSPLETNADAPYYNGANGSIALLNEDGFNMEAFGAISIQDNTKAAGTFMGWSKTYPDKISSGMFCGSTYAGVTYTPDYNKCVCVDIRYFLWILRDYVGLERIVNELR